MAEQGEHTIRDIKPTWGRIDTLAISTNEPERVEDLDEGIVRIWFKNGFLDLDTTGDNPGINAYRA